MNKLKFWRRERGLSQIELSTASQVPRYVIQLAENGLRRPSVRYEQSIAEVLGVSSENLFPTSEGENTPKEQES